MKVNWHPSKLSVNVDGVVMRGVDDCVVIAVKIDEVNVAWP